ncbi:MAG TPA: hypothetical protein PK970_05005 [Hyphomicrobiaceae bacterium]|nr:hypothetical protein [Candidatus Hydrogenedentota bacterium]HRK18296.1 hypothetical protein [Hyphomicrobiaceae bacterium]
MHAQPAKMQTSFPSYPMAAWASAGPIFLLAIVFVLTTITRQTDEHLRAAAIISIIMPVFLGSAAWLATRPAYEVRHDTIAGALVLTQTWPVRRTILTIQTSSIVSIDVRRANTDDGLAYSVMARLADLSEVSLSAEIVSKRKAEQLAASLREALGL